MRCAIYTRVSTDIQAEKEYNSCEAQEEKIKSFIRSQENLKLYKVYSDAGFSGASLDRPALKDLLNDIVEGKVDCILTYKIDRLTRSPKDFYTLIELFDKHGVSFISITENFDTSSPSGRLLRNIMLTFAQFEREMTAERTKDKMEARAKKGLWNGGIVPYGYKNIDKKLVIDEKEAECVRNIFKTFIETQSLAETRGQINIKYQTRAGKKFSKGTIDNILRNPIYYGKIEYKGILYDGVHKPIISEAMFLKAQSIRKIKVKQETKINHPYLLGSLLRCAECGSVMTPTYTKNWKKDGKSPRFTYYYRCTKTYKHDWNSCSIKSVNAERIDNFILDRLKEVSRDERAIKTLVRKINQEDEERLSPLKQQEKNLFKEIKEVERKIQNLLNFLSEGGAVAKFPSIRKELENLENKKKVLEFDLEGVRLVIQKEGQEKFEAKIVLDTLKDFTEKIDQIDFPDRPHLFQYLIKSISYGKKEIGIDIFYLPKGYLPNLSTHRACHAGRADEGGEVPAGRRLDVKRVRRAEKGEADERSSASFMCLKNRSKWLPILDNFRTLHLRFENTIIIAKD
jgi:site-specific DNA recombinase